MEQKRGSDLASRIADLWLGAMAVVVIAMMACIVLQVVLSALDVNPVATFEAALPLVGRAITLNSLLDAQWHLLVIAGLLPAGIVWLRDRHVRVDFLYQSIGPAARARIDVAGNLLFAAPFFVLVLPASWDFMLRAWTSDEGSRNDGLNDLWLIKSVLPMGLALLALAVLADTVRRLRDAR